MIRFTTINSTYEVRVSNGQFTVLKTEASNPESTFNAVGQMRVSHSMYLCVGEQAGFDRWHTSTVLTMEEVPQP